MDKTKFLSRYWLIIIAIFSVAAAAILTLLSYSVSSKHSYVTFLTQKGPVKVKVEVADTYLKRSIGLMNRTGLDKDSGMLFVFPNPAIQTFWMKSTLIPLDMIFADEKGTIVDIKKSVQPCRTFECELYSSVREAKYVVETNAGFSEKNSIALGDKMVLNLEGF
ncbi:MAG: DUF192 domain-containing protein [Candidatus Aenigmarchaeota archaeon]|nr:DUF192 domain-containing protein [Candidatus Aenigmarchaeota archaeon]